MNVEQFIQLQASSTAEMRDTIAHTRSTLAELGTPPPCVDFVVARLTEVIEQYNVLGSFVVAGTDELQAKRVSQEMSPRIQGLLHELTKAYIQIWFAKSTDG